MIAGYFDSNRPYVKAWVFLPATGRLEEIAFLVDTGASTTTLHPADVHFLEIPLDQLTGPVVTMQGVGGTAPYVRQRAQLIFNDSGESISYEIDINAAGLGTPYRDAPSLLGRDVLHHWQMIYDPIIGHLGFNTANGG